MNIESQSYRESDEERFLRTPGVLEAYARYIDKYGQIPDSGLVPFLRFVAKMVRQQNEELNDNAHS